MCHSLFVNSPATAAGRVIRAMTMMIPTTVTSSTTVRAVRQSSRR